MLVGRLIEEVCGETGDDTLRRFYVEGATARQIAEQRGEAVGSITNRLSRLRKRFGDRFKRHIDELRASVVVIDE